MTHPSPTAYPEREIFRRGRYARCQVLTSWKDKPPKYIVCNDLDREHGSLFLAEQAMGTWCESELPDVLTHIAALEAELATQRRVGVHEVCSMCGLDLRKATTECPTWHGLDHLGCDYAKKAEAQLATRLPTEAQISYLLEVLAREGVANDGGDFMRRKISKAILALLSGVVTPAPTAALTEEEIDAVWDALRERVCSSKLEAKRCVMVSRADLTHAMRPKSPPQGGSHE